MGVEIPETQEVPSFTLGRQRRQPGDDGRRLRDVRRARHLLPAAPGHRDPRPRRQAASTPARHRASGSCARPSPTPSTTSCEGVIEPAASPARALRSARPRGKTGTTNDNYAVWFDGYTPNLATAAMIAGVNRPASRAPITTSTSAATYITSTPASGSGLAAPMWAQAMRGGAAVAARRRLHAARHQRARQAAVTVPALGGLSVDEASAAAARSRASSPSSARRSTPATPRARSPYTTPGRRRRRSRADDHPVHLRRLAVPADAQPPRPPDATARCAGNGGNGGGTRWSGGGTVTAAAARRRRRWRERRRPERARTPGPHAGAQAPSWRRTSARRPPPSARPVTCGRSAPMTRPIAFMPSPAAPVCSTAAVDQRARSRPRSSCSGR